MLSQRQNQGSDFTILIDRSMSYDLVLGRRVHNFDFSVANIPNQQVYHGGIDPTVFRLLCFDASCVLELDLIYDAMLCSYDGSTDGVLDERYLIGLNRNGGDHILSLGTSSVSTITETFAAPNQSFMHISDEMSGDTSLTVMTDANWQAAIGFSISDDMEIVHGIEFFDSDLLMTWDGVTLAEMDRAAMATE